MPAPIPLKYKAFLSYAHADLRWGKWLHGQLEKCRIGEDLAGRETLLGPVPSMLRPIFRDREDFTGGQTLTEATIAALDQSCGIWAINSRAPHPQGEEGTPSQRARPYSPLPLRERGWG